MSVIIKKVGSYKFFDSKGKEIKLSYNHVEYDEDGWVDSSKYMPENYDLCYLKTKDKTYNGWSIGSKWDGSRIPEGTEVLYWKRNLS